MSFKKRIQILVEKIKSHPLLTVLEYEEHESINIESFNTFSKLFNYNVPEDIKEFYTDLNGFSLKYGLKENSDDAVVAFNRMSKNYYAEKGPPYIIGSINFLPFEKVFLENTWEGMLYNTGSISNDETFVFQNKEYTYNSFGHLLKPFDLFSEETCAAFLLASSYEWKVIILPDHYAAWKNSLILNFNNYFNLIIQTFGIIQARERFLSEIDGDTLPEFHLPNKNDLTPNVFR